MSNLDVPFGYIKDDELYLNTWGGHKDRRIGEIKEDGPEAAVAYFQQKFSDLESKVQQLADTIEASENKGSYLMKLVHLQELLPNHDGLGDYAVLEERLSLMEKDLREIITGNRVRNSEIKNALLIELNEALEIVNWKEATEKIQDVKSRWIKTGNASEEDQEELEGKFWDSVKDFFDRKKAFYEDKNRLNEHRKRQYEDLINEAGGLSSLRGKERFDKVKDLKTRWSELGNIPSAMYKDLQYQFNLHLKGGKPVPTPDFDGIEEVLDGMFSREKIVDKKLLQQYRKSLATFRPREKSLKERRHELMEKINLIWERDFVEDLASKKNRNFHTLDSGKKAEILKKLLMEFLRKDKEDLKQYEENAEGFAGHDQNTKRMLERKLGQQRNKITVKEKLLKIIAGD